MPHKDGSKHRPSQKKRSPIIDPSGRPEFKEITDFRNTKKNSTFWIIGTDPNLDFYPEDFFDDKFSIAISEACIPFPNSTYFVATLIPILDAIKRVRPDFLKKCILPLSCHRAKPVPYWEQLNPYWEDYGLDPIYMKLLEGPQKAQTSVDWKKMIRQIFGNGPVKFVQPNTSMHYGVEVAAILGAKKIILVGCSHKSTKYFFHAHKRGMWIFFWENYPNKKQIYPASYINGRIPELASMRRDTIKFKRAFAKHGVEIVRHRFDEGRGEFVFEEIEKI